MFDFSILVLNKDFLISEKKIPPSRRFEPATVAFAGRVAQ